MTYLLRSLFSGLMGLTLSVFGVTQAAGTYPDASLVGRLSTAGPALLAALLFLLSIAAFVAGLLVCIASFRQARRSWQSLSPTRPPVSRRRPYTEPAYHDDADDPRWTEAYR